MTLHFRSLYSGHRGFDVAEMCRAVYTSASVEEILTSAFNIDCDDRVRRCLAEIRGNAKYRPSSNDRIVGLASLLSRRYSQRPNNFTIYKLSGRTGRDLAPRATSAKGVLRWAIEKYTIFNVYLQLGPNVLTKYCNDDTGFRTVTSRVSQLIFGRTGARPSGETGEVYSFKSSVYFFVGSDGEIHYRVNPPPAVVLELWRLGVPREHVNDVIRYFLAVAVAMLNPLNCYGGEPAVPILRHGSCGQPDCIELEAKRFNLSAGREYGENLIEKLICIL